MREARESRSAAGDRERIGALRASEGEAGDSGVYALLLDDREIAVVGLDAVHPGIAKTHSRLADDLLTAAVNVFPAEIALVVDASRLFRSDPFQAQFEGALILCYVRMCDEVSLYLGHQDLILKHRGFIDVEVTKGSGDYGIDILAEKDGITYAIQCKCYSAPVGVKAVQEAYAGRDYYDKMVAAVLTNQYFTSPAVDAAKKLKILLWDRGYLERMIEEQEDYQ